MVTLSQKLKKWVLFKWTLENKINMMLHVCLSKILFQVKHHTTLLI